MCWEEIYQAGLVIGGVLELKKKRGVGFGQGIGTWYTSLIQYRLPLPMLIPIPRCYTYMRPALVATVTKLKTTLYGRFLTSIAHGGPNVGTLGPFYGYSKDSIQHGERILKACNTHLLYYNIHTEGVTLIKWQVDNFCWLQNIYCWLACPFLV